VINLDPLGERIVESEDFCWRSSADPILRGDRTANHANYPPDEILPITSVGFICTAIDGKQAVKWQEYKFIVNMVIVLIDAP
jgi:hypothetical protein